MNVNGKNMSFEEVCELFDSSAQTFPDDKVVLTEEEVAQSKRNKREARKKTSTFANAPIYRTLHTSMRLLIEIGQMRLKKNVKLTDTLLQNFTEMIRWTAAAYHHSEPLLKINALEEAISLLYVVKITINCMSNLVGDKKHKQLTTSNDGVMRQLVAWRSSLTSQCPDDDAQ